MAGGHNPLAVTKSSLKLSLKHAVVAHRHTHTQVGSMQAAPSVSSSSGGSAPGPHHHHANPVAAFFKDKAFSFCISVFDSQRGHKEGEEYEKVLGFYPTSAALSIRTAIVGLAQAITTFASSFASAADVSAAMDLYIPPSAAQALHCFDQHTHTSQLSLSLKRTCLA